MAGISSKAAGKLQNREKFNGGNELQNGEFFDGSGLELYDANFRMYDAQIGRFHQQDPLADMFEDQSLYQFAYNNPISINDPLGLAGEDNTLPEVVVTGVRHKKKVSSTPEAPTSLPSTASTLPLVAVGGAGTASASAVAVAALPVAIIGTGAYTGWKYGETHADQIEDLVNRIAGWFNFGQPGADGRPVPPGAVPIPTTATDQSPPQDEIQYRLIATREGLYPKLSWGDATKFFKTGVAAKWEKLHVGDTWKIGTTKGKRYSDKWLEKNGLRRITEFTGSPQAVYMVQIMKLAQYALINGELPYGNTKMQ